MALRSFAYVWLGAPLMLAACVGVPLPVGSFVAASAIFSDESGRQCRLVNRVGDPPGTPSVMVCLGNDGVWYPRRAQQAYFPPPPIPAGYDPPRATARAASLPAPQQRQTVHPPARGYLPNAATEPLATAAQPAPAAPVEPRVPQDPQPNQLGPSTPY